MKVQIILSNILAVALAWSPEPQKYYGPQHIPIIHNGVPVDTPAVQHARAVHMAAVAEAKSHPGYEHENKYCNDVYSHEAHIGYFAQPHQIYQPVYHSNYIPKVGHDGYLIDTPEVQAAKAKHLAAVAHEGHYRKRRSAGSYVFYTTPMGLSHGLEDFDEHDYSYQAIPIEIYHKGIGQQTKSNSYSINQYSHEIPKIDHDGQPLDTAEVQHAKALHFAAYHQAAARNSLGHHSEPVDTPEVQHAKLQHFAAHAAAKSHHY